MIENKQFPQGKPLVSISCITYNHEKYIRDCLDGFLVQKTSFPFEVLIHDDASTDHTADIIREYEAKYPDIIKPIYQTENQYSKGKKISGNNFSRAKGKYIATCEGDDYWTDSCKLQKQYDFMELHPECSMCFSNCISMNQMNGKTKLRCPQSIVSGYYTLSHFLRGDIALFMTTFFFRREMFCEEFLQFTNGCPVGDLSYSLYMALKGSVYYSSECTACYRSFAQNSWSSRMIRNDQMRHNYFQKSIQWLDNLKHAIPNSLQDINYAIEKRKCEMYIYDRDFLHLFFSDECRSYLKQLSFLSKLKILLRLIRCFVWKLFNY